MSSNIYHACSSLVVEQISILSDHIKCVKIDMLIPVVAPSSAHVLPLVLKASSSA